MSEAEKMDNGWIGILYRLPANPSRARVQVWRKLKKNGALMYQQGIAMLPANGHFLNFMQQLKEEIEGYDGKATLARLDFLDARDDQLLIGKFNEGLASEYGDIEKTVSKTLDALEDKRRENNLDSACLNVTLATVRKVIKAYEKLKARDCYRQLLHERVEDCIASLVGAVQRYREELKGMIV